MNCFKLQMQDSFDFREYQDVNLFSASDETGNFSIMAGHERFITVLEYGLAKFRYDINSWHYLALPGGVLLFDDNILTLSSRFIIENENYDQISQQLAQQIKTEDEALASVKKNLHQLESEILKRLWRDRENL